MANSICPFLKAIIFLVLYLATLYRAQAQVHLVKDIDTSPQSSVEWGTETKQMGGYFYFEAHTNAYGSELWRSDGTAKGTTMVKDINPGPDAGGVYNMNVIGNTLFFISENAEHGTELWRTDGTEAGTQIVKEFNEGPDGTDFYGLAVANGYLYLNVYTGKYQLWKTNGTETSMVKEMDYIAGMTASGGKIYFNGSVGATQELWRSDGTTEGTFAVVPGGGSVGDLTDVKGTLYFTGWTLASGVELWKSDGTAEGTVMVMDINPGTGHSWPDHLTAAGDKLFFMADNGSVGKELWVTNGVTTSMLGDSSHGTASTEVGDILAVNGSIFFSAKHDVVGSELWISDGTYTGTLLVTDINPDDASSNPSNFTFVNGTVYFTANDGSHGNELWKTDGTEEGTSMVMDIAEGVNDSAPSSLTALGKDLYFWADDGKHGWELWVSSSTAETKLVKDIASGTRGSGIEQIVAGEEHAWVEDYNTGVWRTDGTPEGTINIRPANNSTYNQFVITDGGTYFVERDLDTQLQSILFSNGEGEPELIAGNFASITNMTLVDGVIYFAGNDGIKGSEPWKLKPGEMPSMILDINPGGASIPRGFVGYKGAVYFSASDGAHSTELWKCEGGTALGTKMIADIRQGSASSYPSGFTVANGLLFFNAADDAHGVELWRTDGTEEGTQLASDIWKGTGSGGAFNLVTLDNSLYFIAADEEHGFELWTSDGTGKGTKLVKEIFPGINLYEMSDNLVVANGSLYLSVYNQLWKSDGTESGTVMVKDMSPGSKGNDIYWFMEHNDRLFFQYNGQLWKSDGTECSTLPVTDKSQVSLTASMMPIGSGNKLYFTATSAETGEELFYYDFSTIDNPGCTQSVVFDEIPSKTLGDASFELHAVSTAGLPIEYSVALNTVASIEGNKVTIIGPGEITITASQKGDINYGPASAQRKLIVNKKPQQITFGALQDKIMGEQSFALSAASTSGLAIAYRSSDNNVASIAGNVVTLVGPGEVIITASQGGNSEYLAANPVAQSMIVKVVTGLEADIDKLVSVYPNPATEYVIIAGSDVLEVTLIDVNGRVIGSFIDERILDVSSLSTGVYFVKIATEKFTTTKRIIKK
ncbi:MAG TPA: ELWxxDGT repeat protein [Cyclobacteriaceae bacterium]|nr:ELWxxDGT repeat protein [Cyclobacteriaceae bacterium]